ncbi:MAG TPA: ribonuclease R [Geobacteraceae bacterium]|nr:ribonuclease R [Geobacteraceae bacterium]
MKKQNDHILAFLQNNATRPLAFKELANAFGVTREERSAFKNALNELVINGVVIKTRENAYALPGKINIVTGRLSCHRDGYGFVSPEEGGDDIFIPARFLRENMHGDKVAVRVEEGREHGKREGRVVRTLERGYTRIVGRFETSKNFGCVIPDEQRINHDIYIPPSAYSKAKSGQVVVAEITAYPVAHRNPEGRIVEVLGWPDDPEVEVKTILSKYELPHLFSAAAVEQARAVPQAPAARDMRGRTDLRGNLTVTIDGETARDFDDAVSVRKEEGDLIRLWVSIADVAHYVKEGSSLDLEAYERGTSVYFPDRCIPMLPEELSNGICSLNPHVERLALTAEMMFDRRGDMLEAHFYPSVIISRARLTYTLVKDLLEDVNPVVPGEHVEFMGELRLMKELALRLMEKRKKRGSIDFDLPEPQIVLDIQGQTEAILKAERNIAHRIIEEFMLAANEAVASYLQEQNVPSLHRIHESPDPAKLRDFMEFIYNFGYEFKMTGDRVEPAELQGLLEKAAGKPEEKMLNEVLLRCMKQARYCMENQGHFGLASPCYTHFTSPIRRYPDLVVHRILKSVVKGKIRKIDSERLSGVLPEVADHTSKRERIAMEAEREIVELKKLQFMKDKTGEEYEGFISGVTPFGFFVELIEYFVEGLVHVSTLRSDFYHYVEKQHSLVGENTGETFRIGDRIRVVVALVSLEKRQIDFNLADDRPAGKKRVVMEAAPDKGKIAKKGKPAGKKSKSTAKNSSRNKTVTGAKRGRGGRKS